MSEEQLIPNAVGRLDDVVAALREGRRADAIAMLSDRELCVLLKKENAEEEAAKAKSEFEANHKFLVKFATCPEFSERVHESLGGFDRPVINVHEYDTGMSPEELEKLGPGI